MRLCTISIGDFAVRMLLLLFDWTKMTSSVGNIALYIPSKRQSALSAENSGIEIRNNTLVFLSNTNVSSLVEGYNSLITSNNKYHVSYLPASITKRLKEFATNRGMYLWRVDGASCHVSYATSSDDRFCSHDYAAAIQELTKYFHFATAAVLTTRSKCSFSIGRKLLYYYNSTNHDRESVGIRTLDHFVITDENLTNELTKILYKLKMKSIDFIINILESPMMDLLFKGAMRYSLTHYSIAWLTIDYSVHDSYIDSRNSPWQWLNLKVTRRNEEWDTNRLLQAVRMTLELFERINQPNDTRQWIDYVTNTLQASINTINCNITNEIVDVLARDPSTAPEVHWQRAFTWHSDQKILQTFPKTDLLVPMMRRTRESVTLKVVTIIDPPFTMYEKHLYHASSHGLGGCEKGVVCRMPVIGLPDNDPNKWEETCCTGMVIDLLLLLARDLYFSPYVYIVEDGFYGGKIKNSTEWNGLVQDIRMRKADIAVAALTATADRFQVVDFCEPYWKIDLGIMISTMMNSLSFINWEFLGPLSVQLRIWILVTFILGTILIYVLENQHLVLKRITDKTAYPRYQWREGFSYFSGLTFQRDLGGKNPQRYGARVTAVAFAFGMVIIMTTYTAVLTASKVSQASSNPFRGFKDTRVTEPTPDFKYATVSHTSIEDYFKNSNHEIHKRMYQFMKNYNVNQSQEGIDSIQLGTIKAFIHEWPFLQYHASKDPYCKLKIYGDPIHQGGYAFSVPKKSPWKHLLSQSIIRMKENDVIDKIYKKWFPASCSYDSSEYESVEINYFGGLIFILGLCLVVSIGLLGLEHFIYRHHRRVINPIQDKVQVWRESKYAARRNAIIDPNDISYLQNLHKNGLHVNTESGIDINDNCSSDDDISEGEEELIRMRLGRCLPVTRTTVENIALTQEDDQIETGKTINPYSMNTSRNRRRGSVNIAESLNTANLLKKFQTTLDIAEEEEEQEEQEEEGKKAEEEEEEDDDDRQNEEQKNVYSCAEIHEKMANDSLSRHSLDTLSNNSSVIFINANSRTTDYINDNNVPEEATTSEGSLQTSINEDRSENGDIRTVSTVLGEDYSLDNELAGENISPTKEDVFDNAETVKDDSFTVVPSPESTNKKLPSKIADNHLSLENSSATKLESSCSLIGECDNGLLLKSNSKDTNTQSEFGRLPSSDEDKKITLSNYEQKNNIKNFNVKEKSDYCNDTDVRLESIPQLNENNFQSIKSMEESTRALIEQEEKFEKPLKSH